MTFSSRFRRAAKGRGLKVRYDDRCESRGWDWNQDGPVLSLVHHTAGAATSSTDPTNPGNLKGANQGVVDYVRHDSSYGPFANATLDRDGTLYVHCLNATWHGGVGTFDGTRWAHLDVRPLLSGSLVCRDLWGTEVISKGVRKDFTRAQKRTLGKLHCVLRDAQGWKGWKYRIANHRDWAWPRGRKNDSLYDWRRFRLQAHREWLRKP